MHVNRLRIKDFRNYAFEEVVFARGRNIIVGKNAQGKTNLLEALEYLSRGRSHRTSSDFELIRKGSASLEVALEYTNSMGDQNIELTISKNLNKILKSGQVALEKRVKINGSTYNSTRKLNGLCVTVSFKSEDLNLLRGGPKDRRDWIDSLTATLKRTYNQDLSKYTKTITQKNRLLKDLYEKGSPVGSDMEQLRTWNQQAAILGARVVCERMEVLARLLPLASIEHSHISGQSEELSLNYFLKQPEEEIDSDLDFSLKAEFGAGFKPDEKAVARQLYNLYQKRHREEIARKQSLSGPHRDDISFTINGEDATAYASQGQQRSLVLSLKLAELSLVKDHILESPVLLLDDVLAELDLVRQSDLMQACDQDMQTIITTTHIDAFEKKWLDNAQFIEVKAGSISIDKPLIQDIKSL